MAAGLPGSPSGIGQKKLLAIGIIAGLLAGCGIALARDRFDNRLRNSPDLDAITDAPVLAELPQDSDVRSGAVTIAMVQAPQSQMAEAVRELRTSLRVILHDSPCPVITVTSPEAGDGKTFVAANLAAAWAMSGSKVIVVSADFRRPRLEEVFGLPLGGRPGLADLIRSELADTGALPSAGRAAGVPGRRSRCLGEGRPFRVALPEAPDERGRERARRRAAGHAGGRPVSPPGAEGPRPSVTASRCVGRRPSGRQRDLGAPDPAGGDPVGQSEPSCSAARACSR